MSFPEKGRRKVLISARALVAALGNYAEEAPRNFPGGRKSVFHPRRGTW